MAAIPKLISGWRARAILYGPRRCNFFNGARSSRSRLHFGQWKKAGWVAAALFGLLKIDPLAFVPQSTGYGEQGTGYRYQNNDEHGVKERGE